jgi:hypothetical protein
MSACHHLISNGLYKTLIVDIVPEGTIFTAPVRTQRLAVVALSPFAAQNFPGVPGVQLQLATMAVSHAPRHVTLITSMVWSGPPLTW